MTIHIALNHKTTYLYDRPVNLAPQVVRLRPAPHSRTPVLSYSMNVSPKDHFINWQQDPFNNYLARLVFPEKTESFSVEVDLVADMIVINPFDYFLEPSADDFPFSYSKEIKSDLSPYLVTKKQHPVLKKYLKEIDTTPRSTIQFLVDLNMKLHQDINYLIRMEPNVQSCKKTLKLRSGSCRDSAWLLVNILRHFGLAARFVSGYLIQLKQDVKSLDGPSGAPEDFTDLHAWTEVYIPGAGWIGLDPTSGLFAGEGHIPLACSPEPKSAAPITGALDECEVNFKHTMSVTRIFESPRSTKPYPDTVWSQIIELGNKVENELENQDVRLSMGGEPTFVSIDDMEGEEWNTEALGEKKLELSEKLLKKLWKEWGHGGFLHYGQGKWYPGEPLPRWALGIYWRKDGVPIWKDPALLADTNTDYGYGVEEAHAFITALTDILGVKRDYIIEGYEDIFHFLVKEHQLPVNVTPEDPKLKNPEDRHQLMRAFEDGLGKITGYVLPLEYGSWKSGPWHFRSKYMYLHPGDSPAGLRLPLESLPWIDPEDIPPVISPDPMIPRKPLPETLLQSTSFDKKKPSQKKKKKSQPEPVPGESAAWLVRTALCVQPREGRLYIFLPPIQSLEGYLELVQCIEKACQQTGYPVVLEGYTPPFDERLQSLKITPDPGVIEVNIQPMFNWKEMVNHTSSLYQLARESRLGTEKFMVDGRHTGTGGGNHIVVGGATPADSPFLRRPDLLRSFLSFWNNHPSLSYLFSGLFIGPTSQQPRIDEARHDSLYELEIAFKEQDRQTGLASNACPPWLVDRLYRNLLVDVTGNTHRAEFCIDKLYSPDSASGRLGLLEFRAFEMPPHAQMSLAQQLLLRIFISWFWRTPYRQKLIHWGTRLHDQFMLPDKLREDFQDILSTLNSYGYPVSMDFFHPHFEFRFPVYGYVRYEGLTLELRHALEPWHVLGEEGSIGGTTRFVDSSVERLQVKISGMTEGRHIAICNGRRIPLQPTRDKSVFIAGVRYRAWQPPSCLHPTIPVHTPLVIDIYDTWNNKVLCGCTYYVGHPGGRNYDTFPVNGFEAEGRRNARFAQTGHSPGQQLVLPTAEINPYFPCTLDLRT